MSMSTVEAEIAAPVEHAIKVADLRVDLDDHDVYVIQDISFDLKPGEILGLIGESGSGKTTVGSALLGYARPGSHITGGSVVIDGVDVLALNPSELRHYRGGTISYVPQDPGSALNPSLRIGTQLEETLAAHGIRSRADRRTLVCQMLDEVKLPSDRSFLRRYPHELSGGQQQRVVIANAFLCKPKVVVLDEPTTGLDVTTQAHVLQTVRALCTTHRTASVYVSHDLAVVGELADRIAVMYYGQLAEIGPAADVAQRPAHPYTRGLIEVIPDPKRRRTLHSIRGGVGSLNDRPAGCVFADRCDFVEEACRSQEIESVVVGEHRIVRCRRTEYLRTLPAPGDEVAADAVRATGTDDGYLTVSDLTASYSGRKVLHGIDLAVPRGAVTALVGESGSGKTTLARCIGGLHDEATGNLTIDGQALHFGARHRSHDERHLVQYIFQNATSALNPRRTIGESIAEPLLRFGDNQKPSEMDDRVHALLEDVALNPRFAAHYPAQLSGGERQRATIARALAADPSILVCDEITSALDVSVQASILRLVQRLCKERDLTVLFVTHNLAVVRAIADRIAVLNGGRICEEGTSDTVLDAPHDPYTKQLLEDTPTLTFG